MIPQSLFDEADQLSEDSYYEPEILDLLNSNSLVKSHTRAEWENEVRRSAALEKLMRQANQNYAYDLESFIDDTAKRVAIENLRRPIGRLLLTFHGGFSTLKRKFLIRCRKECNCVILRKSEVVEDRRAILFTALRSLQDGRSVVMAPDGPHGKRAASIRILGKSVEVGDGAAFLAATSRCKTAWYTVVLDSDRFLPVIEEGPEIEQGESSATFSERLYAFYSQKIEAVLTGDPRNIVLGPRWRRFLMNSPYVPSALQPQDDLA